MKLLIKNCSSPGASFTENTNFVIISCYEWISENPKDVKSFFEFRKDVSEAKGFNDNNARNIFPLLKKCGFINYKRGSEIKYSDFFSKTGLSYANVLYTTKIINENANYSKLQKKEAIKEFNEINELFIYQGIINLLRDKGSNYSRFFMEFIKWLLKFGKINKNEFAYMLYEIENETIDNFEVVEANLNLYRNKKLSFDVGVNVRNDNIIKEKTHEDCRQEDLSFLTAFSYFSALLLQAGLTEKDNSYQVLKVGEKEKLHKIIEEITNE